MPWSLSLYAIVLLVNDRAGLLALTVIVATISLLVFKSWYQNKFHSFRLLSPSQSPEANAECNASRKHHEQAKLDFDISSSSNNTSKQSVIPRHKKLIQESATSISNTRKSCVSPCPSKVFYPKSLGNVDLNKKRTNLQRMKTAKQYACSTLPTIPAMNKNPNERLSEKLNSTCEYNRNQEHNQHKDSTEPGELQVERAVPIKQIQSEQEVLDQTSHPQYLDGYHTLSHEQKKFLNAIKTGDMSTIQHMCKHTEVIKRNINFNGSQVIRDCALENKLNILKYLKQNFVKEIDFNCENGYCLRWSVRKGFYGIVHYLLCEQQYQTIDISPFQYQAIEWAIIYKHRQIAKLVQKYYNESKLSEKWNILSQSQRNLGVEFDRFNLPSIYQEIIEKIINVDAAPMNQENIDCIKEYFENGCDLKFANCMAWTVAVDCKNLGMLQFLHKDVEIDPLFLDSYLLRAACDMRSIELVKFAKSIIPWKMWKSHVEPKLRELKKMCSNDPEFVKELENYRAIQPIKKKNNAARIRV